MHKRDNRFNFATADEDDVMSVGSIAVDSDCESSLLGCGRDCASLGTVDSFDESEA